MTKTKLIEIRNSLLELRQSIKDTLLHRSETLPDAVLIVEMQEDIDKIESTVRVLNKRIGRE